MILNYDFVFLAMLLAERAPETNSGRCPVSPFKKRPFLVSDRGMQLAADESVILAYWQLRDGVADHGAVKGLKYRACSAALESAYRKAAQLRPEFDRETREQLEQLAHLEETKSASMDAAADTFAQLLAGAADEVPDPTRRRILHQILYHLGRWVYLVDAADDLQEDTKQGRYNPLAVRYHLQDGKLDPASRQAFAMTLDHSIHLMTTAYELWDFGVWSGVLETTFYQGLFQVGKSVLDGTFRNGSLKEKKDKDIDC